MPRVAVFEAQYRSLQGLGELQEDLFATVAEIAGVFAGDVDSAAVSRAEGSCVADDHDVLARLERRLAEHEVNAPAQTNAGQVQCRFADVLQFDVVEIAPVGGVVHQLGDAQAGEQFHSRQG